MKATPEGILINDTANKAMATPTAGKANNPDMINVIAAINNREDNNLTDFIFLVFLFFECGFKFPSLGGLGEALLPVSPELSFEFVFKHFKIFGLQVIELAFC